MSSAPGMCQAYPDYTSGAPEDVSTALHGSGEGSLCTKVHVSCGSPLARASPRPPSSPLPSLEQPRRGHAACGAAGRLDRRAASPQAAARVHARRARH